MFSCIVLCQNAGICIRIIASDYNKRLDVKLAYYLQSLLKLFCFFKFRTSGTYHVEAAGVAIVLNKVCRYFNIIVTYKPTGTKYETEKSVFGVKFLYRIEETRYDVMTTGSLTAAEDNTDIHHCCIRSFGSDKLNERHAISIWEQCLYLFLIVCTLCRGAFFYAHCATQRNRQFGNIRGSRLL